MTLTGLPGEDSRELCRDVGFASDDADTPEEKSEALTLVCLVAIAIVFVSLVSFDETPFELAANRAEALEAAWDILQLFVGVVDRA